MEPYLSELNFAGRTTLSQFKCRSNKLPIATGHHCQDLQSRCSLCNTGSVALLLGCSPFSRASSELLKPRFNRRPNTLKMAALYCGDASGDASFSTLSFDCFLRTITCADLLLSKNLLPVATVRIDSTFHKAHLSSSAAHCCHSLHNV